MGAPLRLTRFPSTTQKEAERCPTSSYHQGQVSNLTELRKNCASIHLGNSKELTEIFDALLGILINIMT